MFPGFLAVLVISLMIMGPASAGSMVVISSSTPEFKPGTVLDGSKPVKLAKGVKVTLVSAAGKTVKLSGPYNDVPDKSNKADDPSLIKALSDIVKPASKDMSTAGVMRASLYVPKDPWVVDSGQSGNYCMVSGKSVNLWRAIAIGAASAILSNGTGETTVTWADGETHTAWPTGMPLLNGGRYRLRFTTRKNVRELTLLQLPGRMPSDAHRAVWMHRNGCTQQAKALLARLS